MNKSIEETRLIEISSHIKNIKPKFKQILIGIDGFGGSGKSSLAFNLKRLDDNIEVVTIDDFYKTSSQRNTNNINISNINPDYDWQRLEQQILIPLKNGEKIRYQKYDWKIDKLTEWVEVPENKIIVLEGVYCFQQDFFNYFDYKIWVNTPKDIRLERAIERDGIEKLNLWLDYWMPIEANYYKNENPHLKADLIVDSH